MNLPISENFVSQSSQIQQPEAVKTQAQSSETQLNENPTQKTASHENLKAAAEFGRNVAKSLGFGALGVSAALAVVIVAPISMVGVMIGQSIGSHKDIQKLKNPSLDEGRLLKEYENGSKEFTNKYTKAGAFLSNVAMKATSSAFKALGGVWQKELVSGNAAYETWSKDSTKENADAALKHLTSAKKTLTIFGDKTSLEEIDSKIKTLERYLSVSNLHEKATQAVDNLKTAYDNWKKTPTPENANTVCTQSEAAIKALKLAKEHPIYKEAPTYKETIDEFSTDIETVINNFEQKTKAASAKVQDLKVSKHSAEHFEQATIHIKEGNKALAGNDKELALKEYKQALSDFQIMMVGASQKARAIATPRIESLEKQIKNLTETLSKDNESPMTTTAE